MLSKEFFSLACPPPMAIKAYLEGKLGVEERSIVNHIVGIYSIKPGCRFCQEKIIRWLLGEKNILEEPNIEGGSE